MEFNTAGFVTLSKITACWHRRQLCGRSVQLSYTTQNSSDHFLSFPPGEFRHLCKLLAPLLSNHF